MSLRETINGLTLNKSSADQRRSTELMADGCSQGEENPYLAARRTWNDHTASLCPAAICGNCSASCR